MHEVQVGVAFHRVFLLQLAGKNISGDDVKDAYPSFYNNKAKERFADHQIRDDFIKYISEQIYFFRKGFDSVFGKSIIELLTYWGIDLDDLNLVLKGDLNLGFNSCERTHVNHGNNESEPLMSQFLKINRQRLKITKSKWQKDGRPANNDPNQSLPHDGIDITTKSKAARSWKRMAREQQQHNTGIVIRKLRRDNKEGERNDLNQKTNMGTEDKENPSKMAIQSDKRKGNQIVEGSNKKICLNSSHYDRVEEASPDWPQGNK
ncbi:hypothetical protein GH714_006236 [Hevea brasiliensis]|uniref:Uncharacterized protein n=1 Tax=Hevea brasiliensis TaxID=3981 RepID=A0A6A6KY96_HEVBR|nr:hypothetical protein GH714_006236 [Hevea brasiliensis]